MSSTAGPEARIIGQALSDANFRRKLLADPVQTLRSEGVEVPDGVSCRSSRVPRHWCMWSYRRRSITARSSTAISNAALAEQDAQSLALVAF
jgi:hypothetical protein